jgi:light-harvesting protein B-800-850 alpha chain
MNQARIWCVVKPTVGLPLFLGTVLAIALLVHYAVLSHTTWFAAYLQGGAKAHTAAVTPSTATAGPVASSQ